MSRISVQGELQHDVTLVSEAEETLPDRALPALGIQTVAEVFPLFRPDVVLERIEPSLCATVTRASGSHVTESRQTTSCARGSWRMRAEECVCCHGAEHKLVIEALHHR